MKGFGIFNSSLRLIIIRNKDLNIIIYSDIKFESLEGVQPTSEEDLQCAFCSFSTDRIFNLSRHIKRRHSKLKRKRASNGAIEDLNCKEKFYMKYVFYFYFWWTQCSWHFSLISFYREEHSSAWKKNNEWERALRALSVDAYCIHI